MGKIRMNLITLALGLTFFILAFMILLGSLNFVNSNTAQVDKTAAQNNCVELSYEVNTISYDANSKELSFVVKQKSEFSNEPLIGISVRPEDKSELQTVMFQKKMNNGQSESVVVKNITITDNLFFVSTPGCPSDYEKRCYVSKGICG
jgi:hypothetical protein